MDRSRPCLVCSYTMPIKDYFTQSESSYLLSPQTSPIGGIGSPSTRITLLGGKNPLTYPNFTKDADSFILSEILEFALSLVPVTKGQEPFHGLPHLQAYRFIQALSLAEMGDMQLANRFVFVSWRMLS